MQPISRRCSKCCLVPATGRDADGGGVFRPGGIPEEPLRSPNQREEMLLPQLRPVFFHGLGPGGGRGRACPQVVRCLCCTGAATAVFHSEDAPPTQETPPPGPGVLLSHWLLLFSGVADSFETISVARYLGGGNTSASRCSFTQLTQTSPFGALGVGELIKPVQDLTIGAKVVWCELSIRCC